MTELIYQLDSYKKEFDANVIAVNAEQHGIQLEKTCFYPGGGGQPYDKGILSINGQDLYFKRARIIAGEHWHLLN